MDEQTQPQESASIEIQTKKDRRPMIAIVVVVLLLQIVIFSLVFYFANRKSTPTDTTQNYSEKLVIGVSLGPLRTERWQKDVDLLVEYGEMNNVTVNVLVANEDAELQLAQAENLINQGVDALIIIPLDGEKIAPIIDKAHDAGIEVIAYDRMINHTDLDYYVSFDSIKVGEYEAQGVVDIISKGKFIYLGGSEVDNNAFLLKEGTLSVIQSYLDNGDIELVIDTFVDAWKTETAYQIVYDYLAAGNHLDAIISANDGMADGAIQALKEFDLAGEIPISGQDAELTACQRVAEGTQTLTVYKPLATLAEKAMQMAVQSAKKETVETNDFTENKQGIQIPSFLLGSTPVYKNNLVDSVIKDGFHTFEEIFRNIPESDRPQNQ